MLSRLSVKQVISWLLLAISVYMVIAGVLLLRRARKPGIVRVDDKLFKFEKTTELVTTGIFKYVRHPLYSFTAVSYLGYITSSTRQSS